MKKPISLLIIPLIFLLFAPLIFPFNARAQGIIDGDLIRIEGGFDVYIVKLIPSINSGQAEKYKRLILNPEIFNQYGHLKWGNIKTVTLTELNEYETSDLVRAVGDEKVYKLYSSADAGEKRWIKSADDFLDLGYNWNAIYTINEFERDFYTAGEDLEAPATPVQEPAPESTTPSRNPITIKVPGDYSTIQAALDAAIDGDTISVSSGTYKENLLISKNIKLIGSYAVSTIIDGQGWGAAITVDSANDFLIQKLTIKSQNNKAVYCSGENLSKGTIKNTIVKDSKWGIVAGKNCNLTILNNLIYNNRSSANNEGSGILFQDNTAYDFVLEIRNNTIDDNYHGIWSKNADLKIINNIVSNNVGGNDSAGIYHSDGGTAAITYNDVWHNGFNYSGDAVGSFGNITLDPEFNDRVNRNYKLKWESTASAYYSKCIDAGHPDSYYNDSIFFTSSSYRNDMGAYGGPDNFGWGL